VHPVIFTIPILGGIKLHTYGLMVALGFLVGIAWVAYEAKRVGEPPEKLMDLCFYVVVAAILGSRLYYMLESEPDFWRRPLDFFKIWQGGLVFQGGLIGAVLVAIWYLRRHRLSFWKVADIFIPGVAIGHAFGRIGCFSAGCCYGRPAPVGFPLSVIFPSNPECLAPSGVPLYPTQLMESFAELCIFLILVWFRKKKKFDGQVMLLYLILYSIVRICLEFLRGDQTRSFEIGQALRIGHVFSNAQILSFSFIAFAVIIWMVRSRRSALGGKS
jgi:phosphatidylglycerol:prolipoprotein diacylglycerol transferase